MLKNKHLAHDLALLFKAEEYKMIAKWFSYWQDMDEKIDKCLLFGHFFMPEYFRDKSPLFHRKLLRDYFSDENEYTAAPRGFSKTTLFQCGILFECVNELQEFIAVIEKTFTEAAEVIAAVRDECAENELLFLCYGDLINNKKSKRVLTGMKSKDKDSQGDVFINGVRLRAKGFDQPVRGLKSKAWRPTKILLDDTEQDKHINSPEQRKKYKDNYRKGVIPAVDPKGTIKVFGTILHQDSMLMGLINQHNGKIYRAYYKPSDQEWNSTKRITKEIIVDGQPVRLLWAARWSWERLMKKKREMASEGQSSNAFEQEYRNNPIAEEERKFKYEWLHNPNRVIKLSDLLRAKVVLRGFAAIDAADSTSIGSDWTASVVHLLDQYNNWYRVHVKQEKRNINDLINLIFEIWERWSPMGLEKVGIEKKAFNDQVKPLLEEAMKIRGKYPVVEELKPMGRSKESRILGALQGRYEYGKIWTVVDDSGKPVGHTELLLDQLYNFPGSKHDDLSDAEAYISDIAEAPSPQRSDNVPHHDPSDDPYEDDSRSGDRIFSDGDVIHGTNNEFDDPYG